MGIGHVAGPCSGCGKPVSAMGGAHVRPLDGRVFCLYCCEVCHEEEQTA